MVTPRNRNLDLVLFGATGFTGALTAEYLARNAPSGLRWALAGRNLDKLERVRARLAEIDAELKELELIEADSSDSASMVDLAGRARVVITTVGPYVQHGEPLVAACAAAGTDYIDITGEGEFVDRMYVAHHATAENTGARIVHACGFDSVPHDLGAYYTIRQLAPAGPVRMHGVVRAAGMVSGGTFHSAIAGFTRTRQMREAAQARKRVQPRPEVRRSRAVAGKPHRDKLLGYWLLPLPTIDPAIVARSGAALLEYGPDFTYSHYAGTKTLRYAVGGAVGVGTIGLAAQVPPLRNFLLSRIKRGEGPDDTRRERSRFTVDFVAETDGRTVHTRVSGGDAYELSAIACAEGALSLAFDDNPETAGCVTTAQAMGDNLTARLVAAGIRFEVRD